MKTALITGANKGIGFEIARQLGQKGFRVLLSARSTERGQKATQILQNEGLSVEFIQMDVGDIPSIESAFEKVQQLTEKLDVLINNAAILEDRDKNILTVPAEIIHNTLNINSMGVLWVTRTFSSLLNSGSRVINISSGSGAICDGAQTYAPIYCVSKTFENGLTLQLAHAFQPKGVLVNAICPGWVRTDMGGKSADRPIEKGAETPVWMASDPTFSETGKFFRDKAEINW